MTLTSLRGGTGQSGPTTGSVSGRQYADIGDLTLESGRVLPGVRMAYETWGRLNAAGDNAVLVLHALTGDSHVVGPAGPDQPTHPSGQSLDHRWISLGDLRHTLDYFE